VTSNTRYCKKLKHFSFLAKKELLTHYLDADVLLVEDCKLQQYIISQFLSNFGLSTICIGSATEASLYIEFLSNFNIFISDIELPDKSGLNLMQAMNSYHGKKVIPSIAMSSNQNYKSKALDIGFDIFINKPVSEQALEHALDFLRVDLSHNNCIRSKARC
jgi:CheY-like chemotaxis protein